MRNLTKNRLIKKLKSILPNYPIKKAWLFGSYATGEANENSDIDLLVVYDKNESFSLFTIGKIISELTRFMGTQVDLVEEGRLLPFAQSHTDNTKILIYERTT